MSFTSFSTATGLTGLIITATTLLPFLPTRAIAEPGTPVVQVPEVYAPVGCRITRDQIGVYQEPNLGEAALGILAKDATVTLGTGSGNGWARIMAPQTGWVQAKFLRGSGATPCPAEQVPPLAAVPASGNSVTSDMTSNGNMPVTTPAPPQAPGAVSRTVCAVLPEAGLIVRDQPNLTNSRVIGSIRPGNYTFQFSRDRRTTSQSNQPQRQWAYITAPAKGWVSTGIVGDGSNLAGNGCS